MASKVVQRTVPVLAGSLWWRVAGVSGFSAITLGAYGQHKLAERDEGDLKTWRTANRYRDTVSTWPHPKSSNRKKYLTTNIARAITLINNNNIRYHLAQSVALLAVPFARRPNLAGAVMSLGMLGFCGSLYLVVHQDVNNTLAPVTRSSCTSPHYCTLYTGSIVGQVHTVRRRPDDALMACVDFVDGNQAIQ